jgi:hypothetical protein
VGADTDAVTQERERIRKRLLGKAEYSREQARTTRDSEDRSISLLLADVYEHLAHDLTKGEG